MATWHTPQSIREQWKNAPKHDGELGDLLELSREKALEWKPLGTVPEGEDPATWCETKHRVAQRQLVQYFWEASKAAVDGDALGGIEGFQTNARMTLGKIKFILVTEVEPDTAAGKVG